MAKDKKSKSSEKKQEKGLGKGEEELILNLPHTPFSMSGLERPLKSPRGKGVKGFCGAREIRAVPLLPRMPNPQAIGCFPSIYNKT